MKLRTGMRWIFLGLAVSAGLLAGCSAPPPCDVEPAQVDQARVAYEGAEAQALRVAEQKQALEAEIAALETQVVSEDEYQALEERLEMLKQGSGR